MEFSTQEDFMRYNNAVAQQDLYLKVINYQGDKIDNRTHKVKVVSGYEKIMGLIARGVNSKAVLNK